MSGPALRKTVPSGGEEGLYGSRWSSSTGPGGGFEMRARGRARRARARVRQPRPEPRRGARPLGVPRGPGLHRDGVPPADFAEHARAVASMARALRDDLAASGRRPRRDRRREQPRVDRVVLGGDRGGAVAVGYNAWWAPRRSSTRSATPNRSRDRRASGRAARDRPGTVLSIERDIPSLMPAPGRRAGRPGGRRGRPGRHPLHLRHVRPAEGRRALPPQPGSVIEYHRFNDAMMRPRSAPTDPRDPALPARLPLFHIASLHNLAVPRLATGTTVVMHQGAFDVDRVLRLIEDEQVTNWGAVPTMAHRMHRARRPVEATTCRRSPRSRWPRRRPRRVQGAAREVFPPARGALVDSYGLTESCTAITVATPMDLAEAPGTLGRPEHRRRTGDPGRRGQGRPRGRRGRGLRPQRLQHARLLERPGGHRRGHRRGPLAAHRRHRRRSRTAGCGSPPAAPT